jgi:hypothetical protein
MPSLTPEELASYGDTKQPAILGSSITFLILLNLSVIMRVVTQLRISKRLYLDDYAIIFAALTSDVTGALYIIATENGLGLHIYRALAEDPNPPQHIEILFKVR